VIIAASNMLTWPDYLVITVYLIVTLVIGIALGRKLKTGSDFFLAGRQLPWWAIGMSLVATDIGGTDIIGVGGATYKYGLAVANFEWIGCIPAMLLAAFIFIPCFYRAGVYTIPEFLEQRYNPQVRFVLASCWLLFMACNLGIMLLASGKMMSTVFGWNPSFCIIATALLVGVYTCVGGLAAVVYTDVMQCVVMIVGCIMCLILGIIEVGGVSQLRQRITANELRRSQSSVAESQPDDNPAVVATAPAESAHFSLILPVDTQSPFPWTGIYFGLALILSPAYWIGNQAIVQRSLGARSEFDAKASFVWGALLKNIIPLIVAVPGLVALALLPDLKDGDMAIPQLVGILLPVGLRGLFVAAFLAALMSSVDSYLNSAATVVSHDFYRRYYNRDVSETTLLRVGRVTSVVLVIWAIGFAFALTLLKEGSGVYAIFQTLMAFFQGPALAVLVIGIAWKRATGGAALVGLLCGIATSIGLFTLNQPVVYQALGWPPLFKISEPFLYFSIWSFVVTAVIVVCGSLGPKKI
jgi:solute:Na+ symporter, SSS family